jgi:hypothetical protein
MKTIDELILGTPDEAKVGEEALNELIRTARMMQDLVATEGWNEFVRLVERRQGAHVNQLMAPIQTRDQVFLQESNKGAIHALAWVVGLPSVIIAESKQILETRKASSGNSKKDVKHAPLAP